MPVDIDSDRMLVAIRIKDADGDQSGYPQGDGGGTGCE